MGGGDHLNSAIHQGGSEKFYSYSRGITKNLQNLKNFQSPPLLVKNDTSLKALTDVSCPSAYFFRWVFRGENMPGKFFQALLFRRQKIPTHLLEKPHIHCHLLRTKLAKMLGNSEWNSRLTENSPSCFPGDEMFMSKKSRAKIDLNFLRPSPCTDKKWKSPLCRTGFAVQGLLLAV